MARSSLLIRLGSAAAVLIALALGLAGFALTAIFGREIEQRAVGELTQILKALAAQVRIDEGGVPSVDVALPDPRFETPYGGLYWQVVAADGRAARSRSLWDFALAGLDATTGGERIAGALAGPNGTRLLAVAQTITVRAPSGEAPLRITAAVDREDLAASERSFLRMLTLSLLTLGAILIVAMALFIRLALRPFDALGRELQAIHAGARYNLGGRYPREVQGVVDDLNRLLAFQDAAVERARTQAGDLAHGLKTPLAILNATGREAANEGRAEWASTIDEQVQQMRRQVDRVLARARAGIAAALVGKTVPVAPVAQRVVGALSRLPETRPVEWTVEIAPAAQFPGDDGDLTEILANLLDNARKWATTRIALTVTSADGVLSLRVDDDGPGMAPDQADAIARGRRWDESQPGSGFGLAITRDLAEGYGGALRLDRSVEGGLRAIVTIPLPAPRQRATR